jgi:DNA-binding transcriptional ArsR family regulator
VTHEFTPEQTEALLKALRHPVRRRMLFVLGEMPGVTVRQVSRRLNEPPRRIRHHLNWLIDAGLVVVNAERPRRGTIERTYRSVDIPPSWPGGWPGHLDPAETKMMLLDILRSVFDNVTAAVAAGTFEHREGWCAVRAWRLVDEQGWKELARIHEDAVLDVISVVERSTDRLSRTGDAPIPIVSALFLFEALPWED